VSADDPDLMAVHGFASPQHFDDFCRDLGPLLLSGELASVAVSKPYASEMFEESWYRTRSGQVWRLVRPDYPFTGVFERVPNDTQ
jgi:hypothetical protein